MMRTVTLLYQLCQCLDLEGPAACADIGKKFDKSAKQIRSQMNNLKERGCAINVGGLWASTGKFPNMFGDEKVKVQRGEKFGNNYATMPLIR